MIRRMTETALSEENASLKARLAETEAALEEAVEAQRRLESIVGELQRERFAARSEKLDPEQFNLPLEGAPMERQWSERHWRARSPRACWRPRRSGPNAR